MILNFIFSNLNVIVLIIWLLFLIVVSIRFFKPTWVRSNNKILSKIFTELKNLSYLKLILIAIGLNVFYGLFVTCGQYYVWSVSDPSGTYIQLPYFMHYVWINYWMNISILFLTSGILYSFFKIWKFYRGGFLDNGPELLLILMLISHWPGIITMVSLGFIFAVMLSIFKLFYFKEKRIINIESAFILATFIVLPFGNLIVSYLLKL